jgi:hypothetical protein
MTAEHREGAAERERPERRGRARHRHARVVGKAAPLGQVAGELHVDPRVVEGEGLHAELPRELSRPHQEEADREGERDGGDGDRERPAPHRVARSKV